MIFNLCANECMSEAANQVFDWDLQEGLTHLDISEELLLLGPGSLPRVTAGSALSACQLIRPV